MVYEPEGKGKLVGDYAKMEKMATDIGKMQNDLLIAKKKLAKEPNLDFTAELMSELDYIYKNLGDAATRLERARKMLKEL
jgi:hypothetical protein